VGKTFSVFEPNDEAKAGNVMSFSTDEYINQELIPTDSFA
jgi:hypothetical protein